QAEQLLQSLPVLRKAFVVLVGGRLLAAHLAEGELGGVNDFQGTVRVRGKGRVAGEDLLRATILSGAEALLQLRPRLAEVALAVRLGHDASPGDEACTGMSPGRSDGALAAGRQVRTALFRLSLLGSQRTSKQSVNFFSSLTVLSGGACQTQD